MKQISVYSIEEIRNNFPKTYKRLLEEWRNHQYETGSWWVDDTLNSMVKIIEELGLQVKNYSIDWYWTDSSWVQVRGLEDDEELTGEEAIKWIDERIPNGGYNLTGYYADEVLVEALKESLKKHNLHYAITKVLPKATANLIQQDVEDACQEDRFIEVCQLNDLYFLPDGHKVKIDNTEGGKEL